MSGFQLLARHKMFNGHQEYYRHTDCKLPGETGFAIYLPPQALQGYRVPALYWLADSQHAAREFAACSGAQRFAAQWGIALVIPEITSPAINGHPERCFYLNATQTPYQTLRLNDYLADELPSLLEAAFPLSAQRSLFGQGMGGHAALQLALSRPERYHAVSAFAPTVSPEHTAWGQTVFSTYLSQPEDRAAYDLNLLVQQAAPKLPILIDQGDSHPESDQLLSEQQAFIRTARAAGFPTRYNLRTGYDSSHYFVASFIDTHLDFHADAFDL